MGCRLKILTLGCKVNQYESRGVEEELRSRGAVIVGGEEDADLVILNTCTVTHRSDSSARALVRRAKRDNPDCRVVVTGCYAALEPETLLEAGADVVLATADKTNLAALALSDAAGIVRPAVNAPKLTLPHLRKFTGRKRAYLKVQDGCDVFCAYCIVPNARGPSRSLAPELVAQGLRELAEGGHHEVILTGIHLGFWGRDLTPVHSFEQLLEIAEKSPVEQLRLSSLEPLELTEGVIGRMAGSKKLCPHLHIPLQSGDAGVLAAMGRPYTPWEARERLLAAHSAIEGLCLGLDVITGLPGETDLAFENTFNFLRELPIAYLHVFPFSPRKGTRAFAMADTPPPQVAARRAARLRELSEEKKESFHRAQIGEEVYVIVEKITSEGKLVGHTRNYLEVEMEWSGEILGSRIAASLVGWNQGRLLGKAGGIHRWT